MSVTNVDWKSVKTFIWVLMFVLSLLLAGMLLSFACGGIKNGVEGGRFLGLLLLLYIFFDMLFTRARHCLSENLLLFPYRVTGWLIGGIFGIVLIWFDAGKYLV